MTKFLRRMRIRMLSRIRGFIWWQIYQFLYLDVTDKEIETLENRVQFLEKKLKTDFCVHCGHKTDNCECPRCDCGHLEYQCKASERFYELVGVTHYQYRSMTIEQERRLKEAIQDIFN